ncbi:MAG: hypothetical protein R3C53_21700 [Pirellulaceae bacterium]
MVSTDFFLPLLRDLLVPLILAVPGNALDSRDGVSQRVDLIELNHFYDDLGRHAYDQVIFYEWSPDYRRYHVVAWSLIEDHLSRMPAHDHHRDEYVVRWYDRDARVRRSVWAKLYRETWSQTDPERANKKLMDEKYRVSLLRVPAPPESVDTPDAARPILR